MNLGRRVAYTVALNLLLILGPWSLYHAARAVALWGAYRGLWPLRFR